MSSDENKALMQAVFAGLEKGDGKPFIDSLSEDFTWILMGTTKWSRAYRGREVVRRELLRPLFAQFADQYINTASRMVAEGDIVVVECSGRVTTKAGKPYNNNYCWVCRFVDGKLQELTEYMDTELVATALEAPAL